MAQERKHKGREFKENHFCLGFLGKSPPKTSADIKRKFPVQNAKQQRNLWNKGYHHKNKTVSNFENWMDQMKKKIDKPITKLFDEKGNSFTTKNKPIETREIIKPREAFTVYGSARSNHNSPDHESKSTSQFFSQPMNHYKMAGVDYSNRCKNKDKILSKVLTNNFKFGISANNSPRETSYNKEFGEWKENVSFGRRNCSQPESCLNFEHQISSFINQSQYISETQDKYSEIKGNEKSKIKYINVSKNYKAKRNVTLGAERNNLNNSSNFETTNKMVFQIPADASFIKESNSKIMNQLETHFKMGSQGNYFVNNLSKFNKRNKEIRMNRKHLIEAKMQNHKNA